MDPQTADLVRTIAAIVQAVAAISTLCVAVIVWRLNKRNILAEQTRAARLMLNNLHTTAISRDELLDAADQLHGPNAPDEDRKLRRKRYYALCKLNLMEDLWFAKKLGLIPVEYADKFLNDVLPPMLLDEDAFLLTQKRGFHPEFKVFCAAKQQQAVTMQPNQKTLAATAAKRNSKSRSKSISTPEDFGSTDEPANS
jgi:hypothetical protein